MAPNLFVVLQTCVKPHTWGRKKAKVQLHLTEEWDSPVPGVYRHKPSSGWQLIAVRDEKDKTKYRELPTPKKVVYAKVLHRWILKEEFDSRTRQGVTCRPGLDSRRSSSKSVQTFASEVSQASTASPASPAKTKLYFRLDDGVTWVRCYDRNGDFIPGPYEPFVLADAVDYDSPDEILRFRPMLKCDSPAWRQKARVEGTTSHPESAASSILYASAASSALEASRRSSKTDVGVVKA